MKERWGTFKVVLALSLSILSHSLLFKIFRLENDLSQASPQMEILQEIVAERFGGQRPGKNKKLTSISANDLSVGGKGLRVGAFNIDTTGPPIGAHGDSPTETNELGLGSGISDGRGGSWANSLTSMKLNRIASDLHSWIDSSLYYPKELSEMDIEGSVETVLCFDSDGRFIRGRSHFKSNSNYLRTWLTRNLKRLFKTPLSFSIGHNPLCAKASFEFHLNPPMVYGSFKKQKEAKDFKRSFQAANTSMNPRPSISGGKLFFYRSATKSYGLGLAGEDGGPGIMPVLDVLGLIDRIERILNISEDKKHEKYALEFLRESPEWNDN